MGRRGREHVKQRFLLPDRIADYLMAINMVVSGVVNKEVSAEAIISFSPWFNLSKRKRVQFLS
jgi:hypothetical protein